MSTTEPTPTTRPVKLYYYFWLPAGVDEFELGSDGDRHFKNTANYRSDAEGAIAQRLKNTLSDSSSEGLRFNEDPKDLRVQDGGLGLRKLEFGFHYDRAKLKTEPREGQAYHLPDQLRARAVILSNGLYLWCFDIDYPSDLAPQTIFQPAREFLCNDFVEKHIAKLFDFEWAEEAKPGETMPLYLRNGKKAYTGALTYYQIDLLFNGIFDKDAHPVNFMEPNKPKAYYNVGGIIKSLSRFAIGNHHCPLFDDVKGSYGVDAITFYESRFFADTELFETTWERSAKQVASRMTYAGMEQFLRTAVSYSLLHYKAGLDHCRTQLTTDSLLIRINKTAGELRRDSFAPVLSAADLQAYASIVSGKLPAFQFLHSLIKELEQATRPAEARNSNRLDDRDWAEWVCGQFTLHNSLLHYQLYVKSIENDIAEIDRSLEIGRADEVITELTDTRKLTEIASESNNGKIHEGSRRQLDMLMVNLTRLALVFSVILAFLQVYAAFGISLMDRLFPDGETSAGNSSASTPENSDPWNILIAIGFWSVAPILIWTFYKILSKLVLRDTEDSKKKQLGKRDKSGEDSDNSIEVHVSDYSFFHEKLAHEHNSAKIIEELAQLMPGIDPDEDVLGCSSRSSFRETPLSAVERTKYTLESRFSPNGRGSYIFHIEVDRRMGRREEYLREVRLVIKKPVWVGYCVNECAQRIIYNCLGSFHFDAPSRVMELLDQQFHGANVATERATRHAAGEAAVGKYKDQNGAFTAEELECADKILDKLGVPPTGGTLVYDTDAFLDAGRGDRSIWAVHCRILKRAGKVVVPVKVLEQAQKEPQQWLKDLEPSCVIEPFDEEIRGEVSQLPRDAAKTNDVVEAHVVHSALRYGAGVLTSRCDKLQQRADAKNAQLRCTGWYQ